MDERPISNAGQAQTSLAPMPMAQTIGKEQLLKFTQILQKYKAGKATTERRIVSSENWWKLRNAAEEEGKASTMAFSHYKAVSGWLHNVIMNKHADGMAAYPEPNILPREEADRAEATVLSAIIPCILEANDFETTYSDVLYQKCLTGTGVYKVIWDSDKLNGMGDISVIKANLLNLYWEPGIADIQKSRYFFQTELMDKDLLEEMYPQLAGQLNGVNFLSTRFLYDDAVSTDGKVTVIEVYYHKYINGRKVLEYCKYVNDQVLFATENEPQMRERGIYDHGLYPFVFDSLFPIEGSPCGYGYVDICKSPQTTIDLLNTSFIKNAMAGATPRYFHRADGGVNEEQFLDLTKTLVDVNGDLGENSLREIPHKSLDGMYVNFLNQQIQELRETSGNTETSTGSTSAGVTAASAIAALQEAAGKGSRDSTLGSYRSFSRVTNLVIELIRQFYDLPRQFRIVGQYKAQQFITYTNQYLQAQPQGNAFGMDLGSRLPVFDIKISAQKKNVYTKVSQNELALQFFQLGFFNPQMTDQALMCLDLMDFDGKDDVIQKVSQQGTLMDKLNQYMQLALSLAAEFKPELVQGLSQDIMQTLGVQPSAAMGGGNAASALPESDAVNGEADAKEHPIVEKARAQSNNAAQPDGGAVTGEAKG